MEKYNIDYQKEEELVYSYDIESVIKGSNFIQVDLNEDILDSQAVSIILDVWVLLNCHKKWVAKRDFARTSGKKGVVAYQNVPVG